jgi:ABC-type polysaccharide transport system permease subunit
MFGAIITFKNYCLSGGFLNCLIASPSRDKSIYKAAVIVAAAKWQQIGRLTLFLMRIRFGLPNDI